MLTEAGRERLLSLLREHYAQGHLDLAEMSRRVGVVLAAAYSDEAAAAVTDLAGLDGAAPGSPPAGARPRADRAAAAARAADAAGCGVGADPGAVP